MRNSEVDGKEHVRLRVFERNGKVYMTRVRPGQPGSPHEKIWSGTHSLYDVVTLPEFKSTRGGFDYLTLMNNEHFSHRSLKNKENNSHKREYVKKIMNPPILNRNLPSLVFYLQFLAKNPPYLICLLYVGLVVVVFVTRIWCMINNQELFKPTTTI